jgi:hypothetical protein
MHLLDTDVFIWMLRGRKDVVEKVSQLKSVSKLGISVITIAEVYQNIFPSELTETEEFINLHVIFDVDFKVAKIGGLYWQEYSKKLKNLSLSDCLIAATANINDAILVSLNIKHFPMKDIQILDPLN